MTNNDYELLEMAMETTYASSIRSYIKEADTEECRKQLKKIFADREHITEQGRRIKIIRIKTATFPIVRH